MKNAKVIRTVTGAALAVLLMNGQAVAEENYTDLTGQQVTADALVQALNIPVRGIGSGCSSYQQEMKQLTRGIGTLPTTAEEVPALETMKSAGVTATFDLGSSQLTDESMSQLKTVAQALNSQSLSNQCFQIAGHTCDLGDDSYNMDLSRQRAHAVKQFLVAQGVDGERLVTTGFGETSPLVDNATDKSRAKNRRVDLGALPPTGAL
jgi:outer membrane protein OmpA-like peptidoglycan-associated protein